MPYDLNGHIIQGDCLEVMRGMESESFRGIVTSPPYNINNTVGGGLTTYSHKWPNAKLKHGYDGAGGDALPYDEYVSWQRECLTEMMRLLEPDGAIFYNHTWRVQAGLIQDRQEIVKDFPVRQIIIWHRSGGINFNDGYFLPNYEVIYLIAKPEFKLAPKMNVLGCVWQVPQERDNEHPAAYPVALVEKCIRALGRGPILDPFIGSGTTGVACEIHGVPWTGIEISSKYITMATDRLNDFSNRLI